MGDQVTTVASLPAGYATLAGIVYAAIATEQKNWSCIVWNRITPAFYCQQYQNGWTEQGDQKLEGNLDQKQQQLIDALIRCITKHARSLSSSKKDKSMANNEPQLVDWTAALYLLYSALVPVPEPNIESSDNLDSQADIHLRTSGDLSSVTGLEHDSNGDETLQPLPVSLDVTQMTIQVNMVKESIEKRQHEVICNKAWLQKTLQDDEIRHIHDPSITISELDKIISKVEEWLENPSTTLRRSENPIFVQLAGPFEVFIIEVAFKAAEILFACAIVLGSTGGAWLGLTMASIFPTRRAAGVFTSAYGQVEPHNSTEQVSFHAAGMMWGFCYCVHPHGWMDESRVAVGYILQYGCLVAVQHFKVPLRSLLEFNTYSYTRDAIRYIVLVLELIFIVSMTHLLYRQLHKKTSPKIRLIPVVLYAVFLGGCITCLILAQHDFMKPLPKFYRLSKLVDPIAAAGSFIAAMITVERVVSAEIWIMIWAVGVCSAVF
ncbi:MAG: hypothetical protein M1824_005495 [Vezdaea acicularis]|nr:MAG: hypothetical protein M1824_005495 [Vezdaea acicularis]